ncbi:hypothetical protein ACN26Y_29165 [Micromonospora sp. WMMD558]|uniref:hypothetical protein n=1 Tax=unclassified Micromonospora TaxID=2617518 RepID=UPI0012B4E047|nr:hypothetical protein [Micromonospora sp. WMMC415]QGN49907.1 hypothetical protein GKC29_25825 [Micromonospora sp. WMMC415]
MRQDRRDAWAIAFVLLGPAVAWLVALAASYAVADVSCYLRNGGRGVSAAVPVTILALNAVLAVVPLVAGWVAVRLRRGGRRGVAGAELARFAGAVGLGLAAIFLLGLVLLAVNPLVFWNCG